MNLPRDEAGNVDCKALVDQLRICPTLQEQADILYMLHILKYGELRAGSRQSHARVSTCRAWALPQGELVAVTQRLLHHRGPEWHTGLESEPGPTVKELLTELYVRVGATRQWALIRYISGILKKKVEALDEV